jgi:uncharacterized protein (TIGR03032 family)
MNNPPSDRNVFMSSSGEFWHWLHDTGISIAFTTYQTNRLFMVGRQPEGKLAVNERRFDKPMGLYADGDRLWMSTRYQIWQLENRLASGEEFQGSDRLYFPTTAHTTGDLNVHDVALNRDRELVFVNTDFSCLAKLRAGYSFEPIWTPAFITELASEDRCHLNGLAMVDGEPTYVTACGTTNQPAGWRHQQVDGGVVIHVPSNQIVVSGLSMPHSPRWYRGKLWLLNAGTGELGYVDGDKFVAVTFCPGFVRGLAFWGNFALVGLSKLRSSRSSKLLLERRLAELGQTSQCGLLVVDLTTGAVVQWLNIEAVVEELFDVVVLPDTVRPQAIGLQAEDIERLVNFPSSGGLVATKPTVKRPGVGTAPVAGLPRPLPAPGGDPGAAVNYQRIYHLTPANLAPYDALTFPSLQERWRGQPPSGELVAVAAVVAGEMVGLAVAEILAEATAELLSVYVLPEYCQQGIEAMLVEYLKRAN